jgi:hypothetical protein
MSKQILFRKSLAEDGEYEIAAKYFDLSSTRGRLYESMLPIICRYSVLPFYDELETDIFSMGMRLINTYSQHLYIANFDYYYDVECYTPPSWRDSNFNMAPEGSYVVKGCTNSKKLQWNKYMFSSTKRDAVNIAVALKQDGLIGQQDIIYRKYIPLETFEMALNDLPITNEWRFFYLGTKRLCYGYYWAEMSDIKPSIDNSGIEFADKIAEIISQSINFFVVDIAKTQNGEWILIEVNDGQMSGLSGCNPDELYRNLSESILDY